MIISSDKTLKKFLDELYEILLYPDEILKSKLDGYYYINNGRKYFIYYPLENKLTISKKLIFKPLMNNYKIMAPLSYLQLALKLRFNLNINIT